MTGSSDRLRSVRPGLLPRRRPAGLTARLAYVKRLGMTAVWVTPPVRQRTVQGTSAGYHGYWGVDFTGVDPHLGDRDDVPALRRPGPRAGPEGVSSTSSSTTRATSSSTAAPARPAPRTSSRRQSRTETPTGSAFDPATRRRDAGLPRHATRTSEPSRTSPSSRPADVGVKQPGLAQRRPQLPQPRRLDVQRRELDLRRLLRPRRPLHRATRGRAGRDRPVVGLDPRLPAGRVPARHRPAREPRILAGVPAGDPAPRHGRRRSTTSASSARSSTRRPRPRPSAGSGCRACSTSRSSPPSSPTPPVSAALPTWRRSSTRTTSTRRRRRPRTTWRPSSATTTSAASASRSSAQRRGDARQALRADLLAHDLLFLAARRTDRLLRRRGRDDG